MFKHRLYEEAGDINNGGEGAGGKAGDDAGAGTKEGVGKVAEAGANAGADKGTGSWPEGWRATLAGKDESSAKRLERFNSPDDIWRSYRAIEQRLSSGELKATTKYPDKGTTEQQSAWRAENGIPEAPDKYNINLGEGVVIGELDKPIIDDFLVSVHGKNMPPDMANAAVNWYFAFAEKQAEAIKAGDDEHRKTFEDTMRAEWGGEYRTNSNNVIALLDMAPEGVKDRFQNGRLSDGTPIGSDPDTMRWLASLAREINPITTVAPGSGANIVSAITDEIEQIETFMRTNRPEYNRDEKKQARLRELYEARDRKGGKL